MIEIKRMTGYDEVLAAEMGKLLMDLSSKWDGRPIDRAWMEEVAESEHHDELLAYDGDVLVGMVSVSLVVGAKIGRNAYLEDFVVDAGRQGQGIGGVIWSAVIDWAKEKGAKRLEFTSSGQDKKSGAVAFYLKKGAEIRDTNAFRVEL